MDSYYLTKDDFDAMLELGVGPKDMDKVKIDATTKSAFTRTYNAQSHPMPFVKASNVLGFAKAALPRRRNRTSRRPLTTPNPMRSLDPMLNLRKKMKMRNWI